MLWVESKHFAAREPCPLYPQKRTGIQVSDVVLWLYSQFQKNKPLPPKCVAIVDYVRAHGWENDFSFAGVERSFIQKYGAILSTPLTAEQEKSAREGMLRAEKARQELMAQYERDQVPPFERQKPNELPE